MDSVESKFDPSRLRTVFLDRDGVINQKMPEGEYVRSWSEFQLLQGVPEAIAKLNRMGKRVVVVSNQRGIALNLYTIGDLQYIHQALQNVLATHDAHIDAFYFCPHDKQACNCRKPKPGMFEQAQADFLDISASGSVMIGDSLTDIEFGANLGMPTILIDSAPERQAPGMEKARHLANRCFPSLSSAVDALI